MIDPPLINGAIRGSVFPFILGCPRSGTTLLRAMFDSHPAMAVPGESFFVFQMVRQRRRYERPRGFAVEQFLVDLLGHHWFRDWRLSDEAVRAVISDPPARNLADALRRVFGLYARAHNKERYGDKTPEYVLRIPALAELFPESRFIHIIRDGRDVVLSLFDVAMGPGVFPEAALFWKRHVAAGRAAGASLGPGRYREVRYEDLVADPEGTLCELCRFVDLDFDASMLRYFERAGEVVGVGPPSLKTHGQVFKPPIRARDWRRVLSSEQAATFDALAGDLLRTTGYERVTKDLTLAVRLRARGLVARDLARRTANRAGAAGPTLVRRFLRLPVRSERPAWATSSRMGTGPVAPGDTLRDEHAD